VAVAEEISPRPISASGAAYYSKLVVAAVWYRDLLEIPFALIALYIDLLIMH
jgi:hypothetical protein